VDAVRRAQHFIEVRNDGGVAKLREIADGRFHMTGNAVVVMNDQYSGTGFFPVRMGEVSRHPVFFIRQIAIDDFHRRTSCHGCFVNMFAWLRTSWRLARARGVFVARVRSIAISSQLSVFSIRI
jgi:hypothetical protein